jgi:hypothetical protein
MDKGQQFPENENTTSLDAPTCKTCGKEISTSVAKMRVGKSKAVYLYPPKDKPEWFHPVVADVILNNEGTIKDLEKDPDWNHVAMPADGRSHDVDYQRHAMEVRMKNMANGINPTEAMSEAMKHPQIAYDIERNGFGTV